MIFNKVLYDRAVKAQQAGRKFFRGKMNTSLLKKNFSGSGWWDDFKTGFVKGFTAPWTYAIKPAINFASKNIIKPVVGEIKSVIDPNKDEINFALDVAKMVKPEMVAPIDMAQKGINLMGKKGSGVKGVRSKAPKKRADSPWIKMVKAYREQHPDKSYKQCMIDCAGKKKSGKGLFQDMSSMFRHIPGVPSPFIDKIAEIAPRRSARGIVSIGSRAKGRGVRAVGRGIVSVGR
jgi:hypothetical protein